MSKEFDYSEVDEILGQFEDDQRYLIAILQAVQEHYHYLPKEVFSPYCKKTQNRRGKNLQRCNIL